MQKQVRINIPTFENTDALLLTIRSIQRQTYESYRVYIYDNSGKDYYRKNERLVTQIDDNRFNYNHHGENIGSFANFMQCLNETKDSDYIIALAADITLTNEYLATALQKMQEYNAVIYYPRVKTIRSADSKRFIESDKEINIETLPAVHSIYQVNTCMTGVEAARDLILNNQDGEYYSFSFTGAIYNSKYAASTSRMIRKNETYHGAEYYIDLMYFMYAPKVFLRRKIWPLRNNGLSKEGRHLKR